MIDTKTPEDPKTPEEWQDAANGASYWLAVDAARKYGLLTGGPDVDVARCEEILARAALWGITPAPLEELVK